MGPTPGGACLLDTNARLERATGIEPATFNLGSGSQVALLSGQAGAVDMAACASDHGVENTVELEHHSSR